MATYTSDQCFFLGGGKFSFLFKQKIWKFSFCDVISIYFAIFGGKVPKLLQMFDEDIKANLNGVNFCIGATK
jgi:hypothetical protein